MNFEEFINPPVLDNIMEQIEEAVASKKKYKDVIADYNSKEKNLSIDIYWGKAGYAVYFYDGNEFVVNKENSVENNHEIESFVDKEDKRICKLLESNLYWAEKFYSEK